jgi:hypothetical protein
MALSPDIIGAFYAGISLVAITGGAATLISLRRASEAERSAAKRFAARDYLMFALWGVGLAGGIGLMLKRAWALYVLEFFCYALVVMMCMSIYARYRDIHRRAAVEHINWLAAGAGLVIVGIPVMVIAYMTIAALRSDSFRAAFHP